MKKKFIAVTSILLLVAMLSGCATFSQYNLPESSSVAGVTDPYQGYIPQTDIYGQTTPYQNIPEQTTAYIPGETQTQAQGAVPTTQAQQQGTNPNIPVNSEFDILRSGNFYLVGSMTDSTGTLPLETAITKTTLYMTSEMEGMNVGMLVDAKRNCYLILNDKKCYLEMNDSLMKQFDMDIDELLGEGMDSFSKFRPLSEADEVNQTTLNGVSCTEYVFNSATGASKVYMNGTKLLRFADYNTAGRMETCSDVTSITGNVPADKVAPPKGYKRYSGMTGMLGFMGQMTSSMMG